MIKSQIIARGITDAETIRAMGQVDRHLFVPKSQIPYAYDDRPLSIGWGQTISQPYIVAYMTEQLQLNSDDTVLEIGTGSGYQAAILSEIVSRVYTIEIVRELGETARKRLEDLGYDNVHVKVGDGYHGWEEEGPFDAIIVTAAAEYVPKPLIDQLKEGGRMIIPVGGKDSFQYLLLVTKENDRIFHEPLIGVRFVPFTRE